MKWAKRFENLHKWHRWFAWRPVTIGERRVWLEMIDRKGEYVSNWAAAWWQWEYRLPKEQQT